MFGATIDVILSRTRIKFCGITRIEDALAAAEIGVDAIGLNFSVESPRRISTATARQIADRMPPIVTSVGLFVNHTVEEVRRVCDEASLRTAQLHGDETPQMVAQLDGLQIIKVLRVPAERLAAAIHEWSNVGPVRALLLDTPNTVVRGGTGISNQWEALARLTQQGVFENAPPIFVAGGLTADTVGAVVKSLRPFAVDVSSGIESSPGIKSVQRMQALYSAVRTADSDGSD